MTTTIGNTTLRRAAASIAVMAASLVACADDSGTTATSTSTTEAPSTTTSTVPLPPRWSKVERISTPAVSTTVNATGDLADGWYWASIADVAAPNGFARFSLNEAWTGEECYQHFAAEIAAGEPYCMNDIEIRADKTRVVDSDASTFATILALDPENADSWRDSYYVTPADLVTLATGGTIAGAPVGYEWVPFPFDLKIENGKVTRVQQRYIP